MPYRETAELEVETFVPLSGAERQAKRRERCNAAYDALRRIRKVRSLSEAKAIAEEVLAL